MATVDTPTADHIVLYNVPWSTYETLLTDLDPRGTKLTYYHGTLEIMSPSHKHERLKSLFGLMIRFLAVELQIPVHGGGSTTFKHEVLDHGLEPDECYWVANEPKVRGHDEIDLDKDPPPDLVIEVEITRPLLPRLKMYAALGVPEVWRYDGQELRVLHLSAEGEYTEQPESRAFPFLPVAELTRFLEMRHDTDETSLIRSFREWVRTLRNVE